MSLLTYKYYDTPEGQDLFKKAFVTSKYAAMSGFITGTVDKLMYSHVEGVGRTLGCYTYHIVPMVGMACAFTTVANVSQHYRNKNDALNYFLGGAASGCVYGAWQKGILKGFVAAMFFGACGVVKKWGVDDGWEFFPDIKQATQHANSVKYDWSLTADPPKNWTVGQPCCNCAAGPQLPCIIHRPLPCPPTAAVVTSPLATPSQTPPAPPSESACK